MSFILIYVNLHDIIGPFKYNLVDFDKENSYTKGGRQRVIDKQLDKIEVMILRLPSDDIYKKALESEYTLYRSVLEALPRNVNIPDKLYSSVLSLEQRLTYYVVLGKSANPLIDLAPTIGSKVADENDKKELLEFVKSNPSYVANRKSQLDILKGYLDKIDFNGSIEDIASMIKIVRQKYEESNVRSNMFEQEISKANYFYMIRLLLEGKDDEAYELAQSFDSDMVLFIHQRHKDNVHKLLEDGKPALADKLNDFLMTLPKDKEKELDFWKVLAQIENPEYEPKKADIIVNEENSIVVDDVDAHKRSSKVRNRFSIMVRSIGRKLSNNSPKLISKKNYKVFITDEKVTIHLDLYRDFYMETKEIEELRDYLGVNYKKKEEVFTNGEVFIKELNSSSEYKNAVGFRAIIRYITEYLHVKKLDIRSLDVDHDYEEPMFSGFFFEEVIIHGGKWTIGKYFFSKCMFLKTVDLYYTTIKKIDDGAFFECIELTEVKYPLRMNDYSFGISVFNGCRALKEMRLPLEQSSIPYEMFKNCEGLEKVELLCIEDVGCGAFEGCTKLKDVGRTGKLKKIGMKAFYGCKSLKFFSFENRLCVGDYAFANTGLEDASLKADFRSTGKGIFMGSKIKTATFSGELHLPTQMFKDCKNLYSVYLSNEISIYGDECFSGCENLVSIDAKEVYSIGVACFKGCTSLRSVTFGNGISSISKQTFMDCTSLVSFTVPKTESIDEEAFSGCRRLEELKFLDSDKIIKLGERAFENCERLKELPSFNSVKFIGKYCFSKSDIKRFFIPDTLMELGEGAFNECKYLEEINIPKSIREISKMMFNGGYSIKSIDMSQCFIEFIGEKAFSGCDALSKVRFGKGLRKVGKNAFANSNAIDTIYFPATLFEIPESEYQNAVKDYDNLYSVLTFLKLDNYYADEAKLVELEGTEFVELKVISYARKANLPSSKAPRNKDGSLDLSARANIKVVPVISDTTY